MIRVKNISRVMVKVTDLDKAVEFCEKVLGAKFFLKMPVDPNTPGGLCSAMSNEPGLELMQVVSETGDINMFEKNPNGKKMFEFIRDAEPGIVGVVFDIDGVEEAKLAAQDMGIDAPFTYDFTNEQLKMLGWTQYSKYLEYFLDPNKTNNSMVLLSEFLYR